MTEKNSRKNDILAGLLAPKIIEIAREKMENYGIVSLQSVNMTKDGSLLTCYVTAEHDAPACIKAFREYEGEIREFLRNAHILRTLPRVHFRAPEKNNATSVIDIIHELSQKYDLSE